MTLRQSKSLHYTYQSAKEKIARLDLAALAEFKITLLEIKEDNLLLSKIFQLGPFEEFSCIVGSSKKKPRVYSDGQITARAVCSDQSNSYVRIRFGSDGLIRIKIYTNGSIHYTLQPINNGYGWAVEVDASTIVPNTG